MTDPGVRGADLEADVVVVGAGPAGLTAAAALRAAGVERVVVLDREAEPGGIPRHSNHGGYGLRDLHRAMTGPAYARRLVERAADAGVEIHPGTTATGWAGDLMLEVTSRAGRRTIGGRAVALATGARERPRPARLVPGDRPAGVLTTGQLQNLVHLHHQPVGTRAVIVGAELVSWSAVLTLREAGCATALMTTEHPRAESYAAFSLPGRLALGVVVSRRTRVVRVIGRERVEGVELENLDTLARRVFACDTVVFTGDWIPDNELARSRGLQMDTGHRGPVVDTGLRTSAEGIFAVGNLLHPVDTADVAALDGSHVAAQVVAHLAGERAVPAAVRLLAGEPFAWIAPGLLRPWDVGPARDRLLLWPTEYRPLPTVVVRQGGAVVARRPIPWAASPGRVFRVPASMLADVRPEAGDVTVELA
jgi:thioredoxin reductase